MLFTLGGSMFSFIVMTEPPSVASRSGVILSDEPRTGNHRLRASGTRARAAGTSSRSRARRRASPARTTASAFRIRSATTSGVSTSSAPRSRTPRTIVLSGTSRSTSASRFGCAASSERWVAAQSLSSRGTGSRRVGRGRCARSRSRCGGPCRPRCRPARGRSPRLRTPAPARAVPGGTARRSGRRRRRPPSGRVAPR